MKTFRHLNAESIEAAAKAVQGNNGKAQVIAGGTDLLGVLKDQIHAEYPDVIVNLKNIADLDYVIKDDDGIRIGALTKIHSLVTHPDVREEYGALAEAARSVASPQIRRMGTIGGNICQEPRCWYYRTPGNFFHCTRKEGKFCYALVGDNRYHSIFGAAGVAETPCSDGCPAHVGIPTYMNLIRDGNVKEATRLILESNPMPAITGRVCPHFCEQGCNRNEFDEAVSVRSVERFLGDYILDHPEEYFRLPEKESNKRIAVIGAGPAGLSAAYYLRMLGHQVVVFDRMPQPGGMLMYGIPPYRLPKDIVRRVVRAFESVGMRFELNVEIGKDFDLAELRKNFDNIFIATGTWRQPTIGLDGEASTKSGLAFLAQTSQGQSTAPGRKVVVIGGGNVAIDVGVTAKRLGAEEVTLICLESHEEMPAFTEEVDQALDEGIKMMPSWGPARVILEGEKVTGIELVRCTSVFDQNGSFAPTFDQKMTTVVQADEIILAVGQRADIQLFTSSLDLQTNRSLIAVDPKTQQTSIPGIYCGGDIASGPASVVEALASGRRAAQAIHQSLCSETSVVDDLKPDHSLVRFNRDFLVRTSRTEMSSRPINERNMDGEDHLGYLFEEASREANRCLNCGCVAVTPSDLAPVLVALEARIKTTCRTLQAEEFFAARQKSSTVLADDELVIEIQIPKPDLSFRQFFTKFRTRKSIDFPILSVTILLRQLGGLIEDARIVLGAVSPTPYRSGEAESFLKGKVLDQEIAEKTAAIALRNALPLSNNLYKVQIAKALISKGLLSLVK